VKTLALALLLAVLTVFGCANATAATMGTQPINDPAVTSPCLDQDVWVYIKHDEPFEPTCMVVAEIPKHSLEGDFENCPAQDTKVVGQGRIGFSSYAGMHVIVIPKGYLNDPKNYTTRPPKPIKVPANNVNTWHVNK